MEQKDIKPGMKFGRLTFISNAEPVFYKSNNKTGKKHRGNFICECGNTTTSLINNILRGKSTSCGCKRIEKTTKHGLSKTPTHNVWCSMIDRCRTNGVYSDKNITVCDRWKESYLNFLDDMGERPSNKHQIDRIDNTGNYNSENCRWVTSHINMCNTSKSKRWHINGTEYGSSREAAKAIGVHSKTICTWCYGQTVKGKYYPPKQNCYSVYKYKV